MCGKVHKNTEISKSTNVTKQLSPLETILLQKDVF